MSRHWAKIGGVEKWRVKRALGLRDGWFCGICYWPFIELCEATIDHKIPKAKGGGDDMDNLQLACADCNHRKGDDQYESFAG